MDLLHTLACDPWPETGTLGMVQGWILGPSTSEVHPSDTCTCSKRKAAVLTSSGQFLCEGLSLCKTTKSKFWQACYLMETWWQTAFPEQAGFGKQLELRLLVLLTLWLLVWVPTVSLRELESLLQRLPAERGWRSVRRMKLLFLISRLKANICVTNSFAL